jgi:hypothetical protein
LDCDTVLQDVTTEDNWIERTWISLHYFL